MTCQETRFGDCPACGGDCLFERVTGYDPRDGSPTGWMEWCDYCGGTGIAEIPVEPIEQEDLEAWPASIIRNCRPA